MAGKASSMASARFQVLGMSGCFIANRITHNSPASRHLHPSKLFLHQLVKQWDLQQCDTSPILLGSQQPGTEQQSEAMANPIKALGTGPAAQAWTYPGTIFQTRPCLAQFFLVSYGLP